MFRRGEIRLTGSRADNLLPRRVFFFFFNKQFFLFLFVLLSRTKFPSLHIVQRCYIPVRRTIGVLNVRYRFLLDTLTCTAKRGQRPLRTD
jgi:hypothetical protein